MPPPVAQAEPAGPAPSTDQPLRPDLFVSYSRKDEDFVQRLVAALAKRDKDVWVDSEDIRKSADWRAKIYAGLDATKAVVPVLSPDFAASKVCGEELDYAVGHNKRLVPILYRRVERGSLRNELTSPNWVLFDDEARFDAAVDELVEAIETDLDWLDEHARLLVRALEWKRAEGKAKQSLLARGSELRDAEDWLAAQAGHREQATREQVDFIVASRRAANRRQRITVGAVLVALAISIGLAVYALISRSDAISQSKISRSRELAASSTSVLGADPDLAVILAADGAKVRATPQAEEALRTALRTSHVRAVLRGHDGPVLDAAFSPDGRRVVTAGKDGTARVWDAATGAQLLLLHLGGPVTEASYSPDGRSILTASKDGTARLWNASDGAQRLVLRLGGPVNKAVFSKDGKLVVTGSDDGTAQVWRADDGAAVVTKHLPGHVVAAAISPNDGYLAAAGNGGVRAFVWRLPDGKLLQRLVHEGPITSLEFNPDSTLLLTGADDETAVVSRVLTGKDVSFQRDPNAGGVFAATFSPDGKLVATGTNGPPEVWSTATGYNEQGGNGKILDGPFGATSLAFSPDGKLLAAAGADTAAEISQVPKGTPAAVLPQTGPMNSVAFSRDGSRVVTADDDGKAIVWATASGDEVTPIPYKPPSYQKPRAVPAKARDRYGTSQAAAVSPDGKIMVVNVTFGTGTNYGRLARLPGGELILPKVRPWTSPVFSQDSKFLVAEAALPNHVTVWGAPSWHPARMLDIGGRFQSASFIRDGRLVTTTTDGTMSFWNVATGKRLLLIPTHGGIGGGEFSPNQQVIFSRDAKADADPVTGDGTARLWDAKTGRQIAVLRHGGAIVDHHFSKDGTMLVTASNDKTAKVWSIASGKLVAVLPSQAPVGSAGISPDDKTVVTVANDVRVWRIPDGALLDELQISTPGVFFPGRLQPDGKVDVAGLPGYQRFTCEVCGSLDDLLKLAAARTTREPTAVERATYGLG